MTEAEWQTSNSPERMLTRAWAAATPRKKRLFVCGCCYRAWHLLPDPRCRTAVRVAERFADGEATEEALGTAHRAARAIIGRYTRGESYTDAERFSGTAASAYAASADVEHGRWQWKDVANTRLDAGANWHAELAATADLIRCVFGNPFRPVAVEPEWRTSTAVALATGIYADRAFDRLPVLADALEDAGCTNADVLGHCRGPGPHARGCWVVDLILGKC
jgi:hypothetical protein